MKLQCPGIPECPLYVLGHDGELCQFGCVDDLEKPCRVKRGLVTFDGLWSRAVREMFKPLRAAIDAARAKGGSKG